MPLSNYLKITIGSQTVQVTDPEDLPFSIDYKLEDPENFQNKQSSDSIGLKIPASLMNDKAANTFRNVDVNDMTDGQVFRGNQKCVVEANGYELLVGKAFLKSATHTDVPKEYEYDIFGDNADWLIDLQEATIYDFVKQIVFIFDQATITGSWEYDGTNPALPYVFAPVRYRQPMGGYKTVDGETVPEDNFMQLVYMRPSISPYWIIFTAFKSLGYKIKSNFFDSAYFRRQVMPWTWGNMLSSDGTRLDIHKFLAKSINDVYFSQEGSNVLIWDLNVSNDSSNGAFDNNTVNTPGGDYHYDPTTKEMVWQYKPQHFGNLIANFSLQVQVDATADMGITNGSSDVEFRVQWYRNGVLFDGGSGDFNSNGNVVSSISSGAFFSFTATHDIGVKEVFCSAPVNATDNAGAGTIISGKFYLRTYRAKGGAARITANVVSFQLDYLKIPLGGTIDFQNLTCFQKYKFLDLFRGIVDMFNLSLNTDPTNKVVVIEPTHPYSEANDLNIKNDGYFKDDFIKWDGKEDLSKEWTMENYSDYERELIFKFKDDESDGILKKIQDRNVNVLGQGKYVFPERFKSGNKEFENRFFAATMHYDVEQWNGITGVTPQMIAMVPENVSNTSNTESANTFLPKMAYYKGYLADVGGWKWQSETGEVFTDLNFPYMFTVNYQDGGENDPILSYSDEKIKQGTGFIVGKGLLKRFFWQRLAIMRNGQWYNAWFRLKNIDVAGQLHREYKSFKGHRWELIQINDYKPLQEVSTKCLIRRWAPLGQTDADNTYPSASIVLDNTTPVINSFDLKYSQLKCLTTDIPS